jgi:hypothetical protein
MPIALDPIVAGDTCLTVHMLRRLPSEPDASPFLAGRALAGLEGFLTARDRRVKA